MMFTFLVLKQRSAGPVVLPDEDTIGAQE